MSKTETSHSNKIVCPHCGELYTDQLPMVIHYDGAICNSWNKINFLGKDNWQPHSVWRRKCDVCGDREFIEVPLNDTCPWLIKKEED